MEKIKFMTEDGQTEEFFVEEQTTLGGVTYLLVSDSQDEVANVYIMKDISEKTDETACFVFLEDETEIDAVGKVFQEMLDGEVDTE